MALEDLSLRCLSSFKGVHLELWQQKLDNVLVNKLVPFLCKDGCAVGHCNCSSTDVCIEI